MDTRVIKVAWFKTEVKLDFWGHQNLNFNFPLPLSTEVYRAIALLLSYFDCSSLQTNCFGTWLKFHFPSFQLLVVWYCSYLCQETAPISKFTDSRIALLMIGQVNSSSCPVSIGRKGGSQCSGERKMKGFLAFCLLARFLASRLLPVRLAAWNDFSSQRQREMSIGHQASGGTTFNSEQPENLLLDLLQRGC